jgi:hypothetical protein
MIDHELHSDLSCIAEEIGGLIRKTAGLMGEVSLVAMQASEIQSRVLLLMKDDVESDPNVPAIIKTFMASDEFQDFVERHFPFANSAEITQSEIAPGFPPEAQDGRQAVTAEEDAPSTAGVGEGSVEVGPGACSLGAASFPETDQVVTEATSEERIAVRNDPEVAPEAPPQTSLKQRVLEMFAATGAGAVQIAEEVGTTYNTVKSYIGDARRAGDPRAAKGDLKRLEMPEFKNAPNSIEPDLEDVGRTICSVSYVAETVETDLGGLSIRGVQIRLVDRLKTQTRISVDEAAQVARCREFGLRRELQTLQVVLPKIGLTIHEDEQGFQLRRLAVYPVVTDEVA